MASRRVADHMGCRVAQSEVTVPVGDGICIEAKLGASE
jgi:hypothetical protein